MFTLLLNKFRNHSEKNVGLQIQIFFLEKNYETARQHFLHTSDGSLCATFLIEYHVVAGFPGEIDLFVTQAVLQ